VCGSCPIHLGQSTTRCANCGSGQHVRPQFSLPAAGEIAKLHEEEFPLFGKVHCQRITVPDDGTPLQLDAEHIGDADVPGHFVVPNSFKIAGAALAPFSPCLNNVSAPCM
jgi:hypothetical protein